jgi:hypothetical protein
MSNPLAISPSRETPWHFATGDFVAALVRRWPDAELRFRDAADEHAALDFAVPSGAGYPLLCSLTADGRGVWVSGATIAQGAVVAAWVRGLVPPEQELLFYDQAYSFDVPLLPGTTPARIEAAALAAIER